MAAPLTQTEARPSGAEANDAVIARVAARARGWSAVTPIERARLLERLVADTLAAGSDWVAAASRAKEFAPGSVGEGEEWLSGPGLLIRNARLLRESLLDLAAGRKPRIAGPVRTRADGQVVARVFPAWRYDRLMVTGATGEIWMAPGVSEASLAATQAPAYDGASAVGVALVLGAGNMASIGPRDALTKLYVDGHVVVLKTNPVNAHLRTHWERALAGLIEHGFLAIIDADARESAKLVEHPQIDQIHLTGSSATHDAIVFGGGEDGRARKARRQPALTRPITSELGSVSPVIVVPGPWSRRDLSYQAESIVSMLVHNSGFDCLAIRALVTADAWSKRHALLDAIRSCLASTANRVPYYPGAIERCNTFRTEYPTAESFGQGEMPWVLIPGVDAAREDQLCFTTEAFCGTFAEVPLGGGDPVEFLGRAVEFCNRALWGSLAATILVHPGSLRDKRVRAAVDRAIAELRYGTIAVNVPHSLGFAATLTTWGAHPGHPLSDIQSGRGVVGNTLMFGRAQKSVMRGPWRNITKPIWFPSSRATLPVSRRITELEAAPSWRQVPGMVAAALRS